MFNSRRIEVLEHKVKDLVKSSTELSKRTNELELMEGYCPACKQYTKIIKVMGVVAHRLEGIDGWGFRVRMKELGEKAEQGYRCMNCGTRLFKAKGWEVVKKQAASKSKG